MTSCGKPSVYRYKSLGCRCDSCRAKNTTYLAHVRRQTVYGRWQPYVDATPARDHINRLRAAGIGTRRISELSGISMATINALVWGRKGHTVTQGRPATVAAILAVSASREALADGALVPAVGARRRIEALQTLGWDLEALAKEACSLRQTLYKAMTKPFIYASTDNMVKAVYERLSHLPGPTGWVADRTRRAAARRGFAPPMAWDDDTIDDPSAVPNLGDPDAEVVDEVLVALVLSGARKARLNDAELRHAVAAGTADGLSINQLALRTRRHTRTIRELAEQLVSA